MLNSVTSRQKKSKVEEMTDFQIKIIFLVQTVLCVIGAFAAVGWEDRWGHLLQYLEYKDNDSYTRSPFVVKLLIKFGA